EPRLGIKWKATERLRIKAAAGVYSQNLIAANSDRDVVNLFYGFLASPSNLQDEFYQSNGDIREIVSPLQRANHAILGFEFDVTEKINLNVEGYVKDFRQLTNTNRNKLFPDTPEFSNVSEVLRKDFIVESGIAKGVDFVLKYEDKHTYLWLVYGIANVDRWDGFGWYDPVFDRTHNINFVASHAFGEDRTWEFSGRWNLGSGLPFTQTQGYYQPTDTQNGVGADYLNINPDYLGTYYAGLNEGRLPTYHRLDLNLRRTINIDREETKNDMVVEINAGVTNVYSRANIFYINRITQERVNQLPFLPSIGIDWKF
ncbi:MAG: TonB-dependent receptor, partial [Flavobacteriales bacterium]|nr:TonB-dependent receptor [Flavobacteriales bacterium]